MIITEHLKIDMVKDFLLIIEKLSRHFERPPASRKEARNPVIRIIPMRNFTVTLLTIFTSWQLNAQGSIDIDTNIQMGVAGTEHVKITSSDFSIHQDPNSPIIYADFLSGNLGIGTSDPTDIIDIAHGPGWNPVSINAFSSESRWHRAILRLARARGTLTTPVNLSDDDHLGSIHFAGYNGGFVEGAEIVVKVDGVPSSGRMPTQLEFQVGSNTENSTTRMTIKSSGNVGIGTKSPSERLSVNGNASKSTAGSWVANSDARLKKNITNLDPEQTLEKLLQLDGVTYEWNDDKTGIDRPKGIQYGFIAQNIKEVFPSMVSEDEMGYLQTAYGSYDAMLIEAIRALKKENEALRGRSREMERKIDGLQTQIDQLIKTQTNHHFEGESYSANMSRDMSTEKSRKN